MKIIHFWNDTEQIINDNEAEQLKQAFDEGREFAEIGGHWFKLSAVADIVGGGQTQADIFDKAQIEAPPKKPVPVDSPGYQKAIQARKRLDEKFSKNI